MRIVLAAPISLALALGLSACQVTKDNANGTTSVTYNSDVAENAAADIGNTAQNIAGDIGNDVQKESNKVKNTDVNVNVNHDEHTNSSTTATTTTENKAK